MNIAILGVVGLEVGVTKTLELVGVTKTLELVGDSNEIKLDLILKIELESVNCNNLHVVNKKMQG